jgi:PAS domain S-box-containing protein
LLLRITETFYFRNNAAETLYGWKEHEVIGQRIADFLVAEEYYISLRKILQQLITGVPWSGQFPFKKRSGEIFMAMVTKTPLYEDGVLVGIISVSSDAAVVNSKDFVNGRTCQSRANDKPGIQRLKRVQWPPRPQIASSVSNLVLTNFITTALDIFVSSLFFSILIEK